MNHVTSRLAALLAEELPDHEAAAVRAHLESCPSCRAENERLGRTWDLLGSANLSSASSQTSSVWPAVRARTVADRSHWGWRGASWAVAALAGGVILGMALPGSKGGSAVGSLAADDSWLDSTWLQWDRTEDLAAGWILAGSEQNEDGS